MRKTETERVNVHIRYKVRGVMPFPIDMLRFDACIPASESDSGIIATSFRHESPGPVEVVVRARKGLTEGRWKSFGWDVLGPVE